MIDMAIEACAKKIGKFTEGEIQMIVGRLESEAWDGRYDLEHDERYYSIETIQKAASRVLDVINGLVETLKDCGRIDEVYTEEKINEIAGHLESEVWDGYYDPYYETDYYSIDTIQDAVKDAVDMIYDLVEMLKEAAE